MSDQKPYRTKDEWFALIQECRMSGMTDAQWCLSHGISVRWYYITKDLRMNLEENCIPSDIFDMDISDFQSFLDKRRRMMAAYMRRYYESLE